MSLAQLAEAAAMPQVALGGELGGSAGGAIGGIFGKKGKKVGKKIGRALGKAAGFLGFQNGGRVRRPPVTGYAKGGRVTTRVYTKKPRYMVGGGKVHSNPMMTKEQRSNDSVKAILQPGELVVPVKHFQKGKRAIRLADMTMREFKKRGIKLPGMK